MTMKELIAIAKTHGIADKTLSKTDLVKHIQRQEGNFDCFATAYEGVCDQADCCWRTACFDLASQGTNV